MSFAIPLLIPWALAALLTPLTMRWARANRFVDEPTARKRHDAPVPLLGGLAVFVAAGVGLVIAAVWCEPIRAGAWGRGSLGALGLGVVAILGLGVWDDLRDLQPLQKAGGQLVIAVITWALGFQVGKVELPLGWVVASSPVLSFLITVAWIVIVTNAFNLIDGVDGLSAGVGIIAALTLVILAADNAATVPVIGALALAGALAAFLRFNLPPARIFLGDAGAMGIGYTLAVLSVASSQKSPTAVVLIVPLLALGLPLLDTTLSIVRRVVSRAESRGWEVLQPIELLRAVTAADRGHIHYLLLRSGWSLRTVLFALYAFSIGLSALALVTREADSTLRWSLWALLLLFGLLTLRLLERRAARRGIADAAVEGDASRSGLSAPRRASR